MPFNIEVILFYLLAVDAIGANIMAWGTDGSWYKKNFSFFSRQFPNTKGWSAYYLILVALIGFILWRAGAWS